MHCSWTKTALMKLFPNGPASGACGPPPLFPSPSTCQQRSGQRVFRVDQAFDDREMVTVRLCKGKRLDAQSGPYIGKKFFLPDEFGPFGRPYPADQARLLVRNEQGRAVGGGFGLVEAEVRIHFGTHQRAQIMQ